MGDDLVNDIATRPVHLGQGAVAFPLDAFDGTPEWYQRYSERTEADGDEGRLVTMHTFTEPWETWEVHPNGHELVLCVDGEMTLHQELPTGELRTVTLVAGEYVINQPGVWHTADIDGPATGIFVTAGRGTEVRPR